MRMRDVIGVETLMWGSDYPHTESTFPRSPEILADILSGVAPAEAWAIVSTTPPSSTASRCRPSDVQQWWRGTPPRSASISMSRRAGR